MASVAETAAIEAASRSNTLAGHHQAGYRAAPVPVVSPALEYGVTPVKFSCDVHINRKLSSRCRRCLFVRVNRPGAAAAVRPLPQDPGFREIQVEALAGDVMAGAGGTAGPAPDVRHQPAVDTPLEFHEQQAYAMSIPYLESILVAQWPKKPPNEHKILSSNPAVVQNFAILSVRTATGSIAVVNSSMYWYLLCCTSPVTVYTSMHQ